MSDNVKTVFERTGVADGPNGERIISESEFRAAASELMKEERGMLRPFLKHLEGCNGYRADSLSNRDWIGSERKWRDCTCQLADIMLARQSGGGA